mmetsp:Transcript_1696/g.4250  ORF Transcript_1696/g.4250 Transcript_1696/m.4250 type:complete len:559 (+) Transcript_1696:128-1804(+)|eukprot:CAMPEP_0202357734 /NCGR_PEP_ID=MMETSP1126-20121109/11650_1 /ASSEMBLY_ACC=CAM_ASM_000457 /TAXON_ID=3047 /ORGANISM="Dunaliella tertiolecta, Strain CCMP1320" /LENGTH=558 /DNA_ID=CAMNT_0048950689 /DNA_START=126 /DNA_END=1802 /DNA_ORIENTATION=-
MSSPSSSPDISSSLSSSLSSLWSSMPFSSSLSGLKLQGSSAPSAGTVLVWSGAAVAGYCLYEQLRFKWSKRCKDGKSLPGPNLPTPVLGGIVEMVKDPYGFWERQRTLSFPGLSWHSIVGVFTVFVTDASISRHVFSHNSEDTLLMALHPSAKNVLGPRNIAFLHGPDHKQLRKSFLALFSRKALAVYVAKQDQVICEHLRAWLEHQGGSYESGGAFTEIRPFVLRLNAMTSQEVFVGPYLRSYGAEVRQKFSTAYRAMTDAFLALPICLPGTAVWKGYKGRLYIIKVLTRAAKDSKEKMATGKHEPACLLDFWSLQVLAELKECKEKGQPPPFYAADAKMADSIMDFLFASQDASTASLVWTLTLMAERPDILEKVREEQRSMRPDLNAPITGELLNKMSYTRQVVKEILRYRPPAPMVPQIAQKPFKLTENYTAPKGAMIVPSVWSASMQGYENPDAFDPDRFGPERQEDIKYAPNFLVFGHGPHYCVGKEYATNHLTCFLARTSTTLNWTRQRSKESDKTIYLPTLYPGDSVFQMQWAYPTASQANLAEGAGRTL